MNQLNLNKPATPSLAERIGFLIYRLTHPFANHHSTAIPKSPDTLATPPGEKPPGLIPYPVSRPMNLFNKLLDITLKALRPLSPFSTEYPLKNNPRRRAHIAANLMDIPNKLIKPLLDLTESIYLSLFHPQRVKQQRLWAMLNRIVEGKGMVIVIVAVGYVLAQSINTTRFSVTYKIIAYAVLPLCITSVIRKPIYGLVAYVFLAVGGIQNAFQFFPKKIGGTRLFLTTPFLFATMLSWVMDMIKRGQKIKVVYDSNNLLIVGFWCFLTLSFVFTPPNYLMSPERWAGITRADYVSFANWIVLFFAITHVIGDDKKKFFYMLYAIAGIYGFFSYRVIRLASFYGFTSTYNIPTGLAGRLSDNNELAACLNMAIPILYALFLCTKSKPKKAIFLMTFVATLLAVFFTSSRGALIGLAALSMPLFFKLMLSGTKNKILPAIFVIVLAVSLYNIPAISNRLESRIESIKDWKNDPSATNRILSLVVAWEMAKDSPILGQGLVAYTDKFHQFCPDEAIIRIGVKDEDTLELKRPGYKFVIHNAYGSLAAQYGVFSLIFFMWLMISSIKKLRRLRKEFPFNEENKWIHYLTHALELSVFSYSITAMFLNNPHGALHYVIYAMISSLCYITLKPTKKQNFGVSLVGLMLFGLWLYYTIWVRA